MSDPRFLAGLEMLRRAGARSIRICYQDDEEPVVWCAVAEFGIVDGRPVAEGGEQFFDAAAALEPLRAVLRLCESVVDGGRCAHCHRPTGLEADSIEEPPGGEYFCWYVYDPELRTFRRGCE